MAEGEILNRGGAKKKKSIDTKDTKVAKAYKYELERTARGVPAF
jgi:hypothetical protein